MKKKVIIIGSGSQAKLVAEGVENNNDKVLALFDEKENRKKLIKIGIKQFLVINNLKKLQKYFNSKFYFICAIGSNFKREKVVNDFIRFYPKIKWYNYNSKDSLISKSSVIGNGSMIMKGVIINSFANIGSHCLINTGSLVEHDNILKNFSSLGPGVKMSGNIKIGLRSHIGTGCKLKNNIEIGDDVVIGIGSVVTKNCKKKSVYFGSPAKLIKTRKINNKYY